MPFIQKQQSAVHAIEPVEEASFDELCEQLHSELVTVRRTAAGMLGSKPGSSIPLSLRLLREDDPSVREVIMTSLTLQGDEMAITTLIHSLRSEDANLRNEAIDALKHLPEAVGPHMEKLLADADADVRIFTVNVLSSLAHEDTERWLCDVLRRDSDANVCGAALDVLTEIGTARCVGPVREIGNRFPKDAYIRFVSKIVLARAAGG
ncbi:MAG TPA: HEAT repeat domain-containing protein [Limnobacter sp.]|nr:HEAT repeat domain-containing protein [Limnobacter sp.]